MKSRAFEICGYTIVETTRNCVKRSLTEEAHDVAFEALEDYINASPDSIMGLVHSQSTLTDYLKYFLGDVFENQVDNYYVIGDSRNNTPDNHSKTYNVEIAFTVKYSLVATRITYTIHYKTS